MSTDTVIITVEKILIDSGLAILVAYEGTDYWIPKSQLFGYDGHVGDIDAQLEVAQWVLEEKGMV